MKAQFHIADLFEIVADAVPDRIAIQSDDARLTYRVLDQRTDALVVGGGESRPCPAKQQIEAA